MKRRKFLAALGLGGGAVIATGAVKATVQPASEQRAAAGDEQPTPRRRERRPYWRLPTVGSGL